MAMDRPRIPRFRVPGGITGPPIESRLREPEFEKLRTNMKMRIYHVIMPAIAVALIGGAYLMAQQTGARRNAPPPRPQGPCDIYTAAGAPCVAAHSTTRALYASYNGPLYQVLRQSDDKTLDIGVVPPVASPLPDAGGYADAAAQDEFCANTYCWITKIYDQIGRAHV